MVIFFILLGDTIIISMLEYFRGTQFHQNVFQHWLVKITLDQAVGYENEAVVPLSVENAKTTNSRSSNFNFQ